MNPIVQNQKPRVGLLSHHSKRTQAVFWGDDLDLDDFILEGDKPSDVSKAVDVVDAIPPDGGIDSNDVVWPGGENDTVPCVNLTSMKEFSALDLSDLSPELQSMLNIVMSDLI